MTLGDLITASLLDIGVIAAGEPISSDEMTQAQTVANHLVDAWQAERLTIFAIQRTIFVPLSLKQVYTLGPGGDFSITPRPAKVQRYTVIVLSNPLLPLELPLDSYTAAQWAERIPVKGISSTIPKYVWDDQQYPLRNLSYWPIPQVTVNFGVYSWAALSSFPDLTTDIEFPPGYFRALRTNLALDLAPGYGAAANVSPLLVASARESKEQIKRMNTPIIDLKQDPMLISPEKRQYDWRSDDAKVGNG